MKIAVIGSGRIGGLVGNCGRKRATWLPGTRVIRAFNSVWDQNAGAGSASAAAAGRCAVGGGRYAGSGNCRRAGARRGI